LYSKNYIALPETLNGIFK